MTGTRLEGWQALVGSAVGYGLENFDSLILAFMLPILGKDLHLSVQQSSFLLTATLLGAVLGGFVFGALADTLGRVRVLSWTIILFAIFTGACSFATGYGELLVFRFLVGMGFGGEFGIGMALAAEAWPAAFRARVSSYVAIGGQLGILIAALLTPTMLQYFGWRGTFLVGIFPALVAWWIRRKLHEPQLFIEQSERTKKTRPFRLLILDRQTTRNSMVLIVLCSIQNFGYYGIMIWLPSFLANQMHFSISKSSVWTAVTILGMMFGMGCFGQLADRIGRKVTFIIFQLCAAISVVVYSQLDNPTTMLVVGPVMGMFVNGMLGGYATLMSELYPTEARATAQNVLFNIGRGIGGFGPLAIGALVTAFSFKIAIAALAGLYLFDALVTALWVPELRGSKLRS